MDGLVNYEEILHNSSGKNYIGRDNSQILFVRSNTKYGIVTLNQKVIELYNQNFRSGRDLKNSTNPALAF